MVKEIRLVSNEVALVDDEDYNLISQHRWYYVNGYALMSIPTGKTNEDIRIWMHRLILDPPDDKFVDHINQNRLDNRKENLRVVSRSQNAKNRSKHKNNTSSKYKGVTVTKGGFRAQIGLDNRTIYLGLYSNEEAAANVYNYNAKKYFGEYASLNSVDCMDEETCESYRIKFSSKYKYVSLSSAVNSWEVFEQVGGKKVHHGYFTSEEAAGNYVNHIKGKINECEVYMSKEECLTFMKRKQVSSKYTGVSWSKKYRKWTAGFAMKGKSYSIGSYDDEIEAARAYNEKIIEHGLKRKLNQV